MIRIFLTIAVVALVTTAAAAGEVSVWLTDQPALALESPSVRDEPSATTSEPNQGARKRLQTLRLLLPKRRVPTAEKIIKRAARRRLT